MSRGPNWCFTINNYDEATQEALRSLCADASSHVRYIIFGRETGRNGTDHLQGYLQFTKKKRLGGVKRTAGFARAHLELARGTFEDNRKYCSKGEDFEEYGIPVVKAGQRTDLMSMKAMIDEGKTELEVAEANFSCWANNYKALDRYRQMKSARRNWKTVVIVLIGPTGVGKTRFVFDQPDDRELYVWNYSGRDVWFDGYYGQDRVLFDDFDWGQIPYRMMLRLLDRYPCKVPVKGSWAEWKPRKIYITSNREINQWYPNEDTSHLERRVTSIIRFE
jgi:DUF971 family protein